jgi:hypothetical protein
MANSRPPPQGLFLSFFNAVSTMEDAANVFRDQARNQALPSDLREEAALNHLSLRREIARLQAEHASLESRLARVSGPSEAQLRKAQSLSEALARDIHRAELTLALLDIARQFIDAWAQIENPGGDQGAGQANAPSSPAPAPPP